MLCNVESLRPFRAEIFWCIPRKKELNTMETRIALIGIIVEDIEASNRINDILHEYN